MTDDEQALRRLAYTLVAPLRQGETGDRLFAEFRHARLAPIGQHGTDPAFYYEALAGEPFASSEARYSALVLDVRTDEDRLTPFFSVATKVVAADAARLAAARRARTLSAGEAANVEQRIAENRALIAWVRQVLLARVAAYRFALERLSIETPSRRVSAGEVAIANLEARVANPLGLVAVGLDRR